MTIDHVAKSITLPNGSILPNRFMKSALSESMASKDCGPTGKLERLYQRWSVGGYGLVVTGNVMVDRRQRGEPGNVVIEDERHLEGLRSWAGLFRGTPTQLWMQINHPGRQANPLVSGKQPVAPSAIPAMLPGMRKPRALEDHEIHELVDRYATAATIAERAGFDGVQLHGAHGYLITQFLSPRTNRRTDAWGGTPERRSRFLLEVLRASRAATGKDFAIGIKLNSADFQRGGFTEEESRNVVAALVAEGIDLIEVSGGTYETPAMMGVAADSTRVREAYFLEYAAALRDLAPTTPIAVTGGFRSIGAMESAVAHGGCDIIGLGRPTAVVPDSAATLLSGSANKLPSRNVRVGLRPVTGRLIDLKTADGGLDLSWHTDQLHRLGAGKEPNLSQGWQRTAATMLLRNGPQAFRAKRG